MFNNNWVDRSFNCTVVPASCLFSECGANVTDPCVSQNGTEILLSVIPDFPLGTSIGQWCGYTVAVFVVMHFVGLVAVSFLYNSRIEGWWKMRKEREKALHPKPSDMSMQLGINESNFDTQAVRMEALVIDDNSK